MVAAWAAAGKTKANSKQANRMQSRPFLHIDMDWIAFVFMGYTTPYRLLIYALRAFITKNGGDDHAKQADEYSRAQGGEKAPGRKPGNQSADHFEDERIDDQRE